jgi:metallophosphoesterase (TIGR03767 family)
MGRGTERDYHRLAYGPGEPRAVRHDLAPAPAPGGGGGLVSVLHVGQITDFQLADVQSPGRFEYFERLRGLPGSEAYVPSWRPQEALVAHAIAAMTATLNRLPVSAETGAPVGLCVSTGDSMDNAQLNELRWFLALLGGGTVAPSSGGSSYQGVQAPGWLPAAYWCPEPGPDPFKERFGFPTYPGLMAQAMTAFKAPGLAMPWLSCFGNHDGLVLGTALPTEAYEAVLRGGLKPVDLRPGADAMSMVDAFTSHPELLLDGPATEVAPDPERRSVGRREFVEAHIGAPGLPAGHGFDRHNVDLGTAYCAYDVDGPVPVRVVVLDTTNMDGYYQGSIGARQLRWLEDRLAEVHSRHLDGAGRLVTTGARDRLVVLASHHGLETMSNTRQDPAGLEDDHPRVTGAALEAVLHRFPNVVLWLNGHRHLNDVRPRPAPGGGTGGFWEVSTAAIADWPCQARVVELVTRGDGELTVLATMVDADVPADPEEGEPVGHLASVHRELAANHPAAGLGRGTEGGATDRNVALRLMAPFALG